MKVGIIICERYKDCTGGKCFRAMHNREGAFSIYPKNETLDIAGYTSCDGCPGGNIEYCPEEMIKNGAKKIHLATGLVVGYPPCPYLSYFVNYIQEKFKIEVVVGTHPIPEKYYLTHQKLGTWNDEFWQKYLAPTLSDQDVRLNYN
ncbi:MAG: metal-binding-like protein [Desulfuromonas sp. SDB]|nr:MAG: metal-binding-like protein [Desulfuromonas sp. SDB]